MAPDLTMQTLSLLRENRDKVVSRSVETVERRVMICTAYTANDRGMNGKRITASGEKVLEGRTIAADKSISFGTEIYIPALDNHFVVSDRGGVIKGNRLDLYMENRKDAIEFGVQKLEVLIRR